MTIRFCHDFDDLEFGYLSVSITAEGFIVPGEPDVRYPDGSGCPGYGPEVDIRQVYVREAVNAETGEPVLIDQDITSFAWEYAEEHHERILSDCV